ncbi:MAG: hypothetical protein CW338_06285 [Clostridiales bacterium]|nr:hypothetical protein [Clostridiales bacterium]
MCTAFVRKGKDVICGFNFDIYEGVPFKLYRNEREFYLGIDLSEVLKHSADLPGYSSFDAAMAAAYLNGVENGIRKFEGVDREGHFAVHLGSQDNRKASFDLRGGTYPLDDLVDRYISGKRSFDDCFSIAAENDLTNVPAVPDVTPGFRMHALFADRRGRVMIAEPGTGVALIREKYAVLSNFDLLEVPENMCDERAGYFGKDRYDRALRTLRNSTDDFDARDGLRLLESVKQGGRFATRFSFVYSNSSRTVFYVLDGNFDRVYTHTFYCS